MLKRGDTPPNIILFGAMAPLFSLNMQKVQNALFVD
jgi:hypothetical protein